MTETQKQILFGFALKEPSDAAHGEAHLRRVLFNALRLADSYPEADREALCAAAILHDCAMPEQLACPGIHHAPAGAEKAKAFLLSEGYQADFAHRVAEIIAAHSSPELAQSAGIEAKLLFDADKTDMVGAVGISRALIYAQDHRLPLYSETGESLYSVHLADAAFAEKGMFTPEARRAAQPLIALSRAFAESLKAECGRKE